jgi:hypothetical protein
MEAIVSQEFSDAAAALTRGMANTHKASKSATAKDPAQTFFTLQPSTTNKDKHA